MRVTISDNIINIDLTVNSVLTHIHKHWTNAQLLILVKENTFNTGIASTNIIEICMVTVYRSRHLTICNPLQFTGECSDFRKCFSYGMRYRGDANVPSVQTFTLNHFRFSRTKRINQLHRLFVCNLKCSRYVRFVLLWNTGNDGSIWLYTTTSNT